MYVHLLQQGLFRIGLSLPGLRSAQDCFYASVFEHETPSLKILPLAVQQKQIIVTCNYEARRRVCPPSCRRAAAAAH
jgi:hypothetical protein